MSGVTHTCNQPDQREMPRSPDISALGVMGTTTDLRREINRIRIARRLALRRRN
jgi:hypothetical protein